MTDYHLRVLHISDLHAKATADEESWRRSRVLGPSWEENLERIVASGDIDLVCFTGDVADSGSAAEYDAATTFVSFLLSALGLERDRFFVVPGNHDICRTSNVSSWERLRALVRPTSYLEISRWFWSGRKTLATIDLSRDLILQREAAYRSWVRHAICRPDLLEVDGVASPLGFRTVLRIPRLPFPIHVVGLDSAWLSGDRHDQGNLLLTDDQVGRLTTGATVGSLDGFRLGMTHHPLGEMGDCGMVQRMLGDNLDILLRGHLHREAAEVWADPDSRLHQLAAGCLYDGVGVDRYKNSCHVLDVTLDGRGRPARYDIVVRSWSPAGFWFIDNGTYRDCREGNPLTWWIASRPVHSAAHPRVSDVFVGRGQQLATMEAVLGGKDPRGPRVVALQGMAGVGKTYLVERFLHEHKARFPGGYTRLPLDPLKTFTEAELLQRLADELQLATGNSGLVQAIRTRLCEPLTLLHIENVDSPATAAVCARLVGLLAGAAIVVSGRIRGVGEEAAWTVLELSPFAPEEALEQLRYELGRHWREKEKDQYVRLVRALDCLPLAIHLAAGYLRQEWSVAAFIAMLNASELAVGPLDPTDPLYGADPRGTLSLTFRLSVSVLQETLGEKAERLLTGFRRLAHGPPSGFGRSLGAAVTGLRVEDFDNLVVQLARLSLVEAVSANDREDASWRMHSLVAQLVGTPETEGPVLQAVSTWFLDRLEAAGQPFDVTPGAAWKELQEERESIVWWLSRLPSDLVGKVLEVAGAFAAQNGPFAAWSQFAERVNEDPPGAAEAVAALTMLSNCALQAGEIAEAEAAARKRVQLQKRARLWERASAWESLVDVLIPQGRHAEAMAIILDQQVPTYERLGDLRSRAICLGKVAEILTFRGDYEDAVRIYEREQQPVFEALRDARLCAFVRGKIAEILFLRGRLDEALTIRLEQELPTYELLGDMRSYAVTMGEVGAIYFGQGRIDEAMQIYTEKQLPVYERLGDTRARAMTMGRIADVFFALGQYERALDIRLRDELPVYKRLAAPRTQAVTLGQIAAVYHMQHEYARAIEIRETDELPVYLRLGLVRDILICRANLAMSMLGRDSPDERSVAESMLRQSMVDAERLGIPEARLLRAQLEGSCISRGST